MAAGELRLRAAWRWAMAAVGQGGHPAAAEAVLDDVLARYREPHRHYHGIAHVVAIVDHVEHLCNGLPQLQEPDVASIIAAAVFHDAVYDPRSSGNEAASADLARRELDGLGWPSTLTERAAQLVLATEHAGRRDDGADLTRDVLLDADLAVLGGDPAAYDAYVRGVRAEYAFVEAADWRTGRRSVLSMFLGQPYIYRTQAMRSAREHRARANITAELASLDR